MEWKRELVAALDEAEVFRLGEFVLKSGQVSPIYIDLRRLIAFPALLKRATRAMWEVMKAKRLVYDNLCGVPYAALPLAVGISLDENVPMLMRRKEAKAYGTKKLIEGLWKTGDVCLIVEDTVTLGDSIVETTEVLRREGLVVKDAIVLVDRSQGALANLHNHGINLHSAVDMSDLMGYLTDTGRITRTRATEILDILRQPRASPPNLPADLARVLEDGVEGRGGRWGLEARLGLGQLHPKTRALLALMREKESNLCLAADYPSAARVLEVAERLGPELCVLKLHADIIQDFSKDFVRDLRLLAQRHRFLLMEDRKFADTGSTVSRQLDGAPLRIGEWADLVTVHALPGHGVFKGLAESGSGVGLVVVAEMSGEGALTDPQYSQRAVGLAEEYPLLLAGFVCQKRCSSNPAFLYMTPGIGMSGGGDGLGQQFRDPGSAVTAGLTDIVIVGRGITKAPDPLAAAKEYRSAAWDAFVARDQD